MKLRITFTVVTLVAIGGLLLFGMTKAELIGVVQAKFGVDFNNDGTADNFFDVFVESGLMESSEVVEVANPLGGLTLKEPGLIRFENLILQFPVGKLPPALSDWHQRILGGRFEVHNAVLIIVGKEEEEKATFNFFECWPSALRGMKQTRVGFRGKVVEEVEMVVRKCEMIVTAPSPDGG